MDSLSVVKDVSIVVAGAVTLITFMMGVIQYARQGHDARATQFVQMRRRFLEDPAFRELLNLLANDDPRISQMPIQDRRNFVGFFEEVALMVNSKIIKPGVAHYMFGYYVLLVDRSEHFWDGLDRKSVYWEVFRQFAAQMRAIKGDSLARKEMQL